MGLTEDKITSIVRKKSFMAFLSLNGKSIKEAVFKVQDISRNLYHDIESSEDQLVSDTYVYINSDPPVKVVKDLGWWKEDERLPILAYFPYQSDFKPKKDDIFEVFWNGYTEGNYKVNMVKAYGYSSPVVWVCNVSPVRDDNKNSDFS